MQRAEDAGGGGGSRGCSSPQRRLGGFSREGTGLTEKASHSGFPAFGNYLLLADMSDRVEVSRF